MELRDYQERAVRSVRDYVQRREGVAPVVQMPTGSGKSLVIAAIAVRSVAAGRRVAIVSHRKELLEQDAGTLVRLDPSLDGQVSIYSAGLRSKRLDGAVLVGGVQSLAQAAELPRVDVVLVDECHLVPPRAGVGGLPSQYEQVLERLTPRWMVGFSATPWRADGGWLWERADGATAPWFDGRAVNVGFVELVEAGWLVPLRVRETEDRIDVSKLKKSRGEFTAASQMEELTPAVLKAIVPQIVQVAEARDRKHVMIFLPGIAPAEMLADILAARLRDRGCEDPGIAIVHSKMPEAERDAAIAGFREGSKRWIVNVDVLTVGFDAPHVDLIAYVRSSTSSVLWVQVLGRGSRPAPGKTDCLVLDFGANARRLGTVDDPVIEASTSPKVPTVCELPEGCGAINRYGAPRCVECGRPLPQPDVGKPRVHSVTVAADTVEVMRGARSGAWHVLEHATVKDLGRASRRGWPMVVMVLYVKSVKGETRGTVEVLQQLPTGPDRGRSMAGRVFRSITGRRVSDGDTQADMKRLREALAATSHVELGQRGKYWNILNVKRGPLPDETRDPEPPPQPAPSPVPADRPRPAAQVRLVSVRRNGEEHAVTGADGADLGIVHGLELLGQVWWSAWDRDGKRVSGELLESRDEAVAALEERQVYQDSSASFAAG